MHLWRGLAAAAVIVATSAALAVPAAAQEAEGIGVGIKGGYLYSSLSFDGGDDVFDARNGWMAGLFLGGNRPGAVGAMVEFNYLAKGATTNLDEDVKLYYFQIPVLLRVNAGSSSLSGVSAYGIVGPAVDLKVGDNAGDFDIVGEYEGFDASLVAGAGVEITRFIIEARGTWGLRNIAKDLTGAQEIKTRTFAIQVGFRIN
jgi:hypothetical protein